LSVTELSVTELSVTELSVTELSVTELSVTELDVASSSTLTVGETPAGAAAAGLRVAASTMSRAESAALVFTVFVVATVADVTLLDAGAVGRGESPCAAKAGTAIPMAAMPAVVQMIDRFMLLSPWEVLG
jgi:hypothetical protein